jgi:hypothetical protein
VETRRGRGGQSRLPPCSARRAQQAITREAEINTEVVKDRRDARRVTDLPRLCEELRGEGAGQPPQGSVTELLRGFGAERIIPSLRALLDRRVAGDRP